MFDECFSVRLDSGDELIAVPAGARHHGGSPEDLRRVLDQASVSRQALAALVWDVAGQSIDPTDDPLERAAHLLSWHGVVLLWKARRRARTDRRAIGVHPHDDFSRYPLLSDLSPRPVAVASPSFWIELELTSDDGAPIAEAQFELRNGRGFTTRCKTDVSGHARSSVPIDDVYQVRLLADLVLPALRVEPSTPTGVRLGRFEDATLDLGVNRRHVIVVPRPRATLVSIDRWVEARPVLVFGTMSETPDGPTTVRGALRRVLSHAGGGELHVVGHADTEGQAADNEALALERARSVHLYLAGDRGTWADHAFAHADVATLQVALRWAAIACGIPCDPGPVDDDWGPATSAGLTALRQHAGIDVTQPLGPADWAAVFDLFDADLARILLTDAAGLAAARARLSLVDPTTMGERWPVDAPALDDHQCPDNRRVDLVFCAPQVAPKSGSDEFYDGTFLREQLTVEAEARLQLTVCRTSMQAVPSARLQLSVGSLGARVLTTDAAGLLIVPVLRGDRVRVAHVTDDKGGGRVIAALIPEQAGTF